MPNFVENVPCRDLGPGYFCYLCVFMMGLIGDPNCVPNLMGVTLKQGYTHFYSAWDFMMGLGKPKRLAKFEVAGFIYYEHIRAFVFKNWDKPRWGTPCY